MSKRKVVSGGYEESSDESDADHFTDPKQPRPPVYAPPRLTTASKPGLAPFQYPTSAQVSAPPRHMSVPARLPTPTWEFTQTARSTPEPPSETQGSAPATHRSTPVGLLKHTSKSSGDILSASGILSSARSTLALERHSNELIDSLNEFKTTSEARYNAIDAKLALVLDTINKLESVDRSGSAPALLERPTFAPAPAAFLSNPMPNPSLVITISKVVAEARGRVGKRRGGVEDNTCKEHARHTFYRMLGISAAREICAPFDDEFGEPDTLPVQFVDPDTGYCRPYPHWKYALTRQPLWVPTFLLRFRLTIPNDQSASSNILRELSDEQIVILLNDGPFKSAQAAWRDMKKTDMEVDAMRSTARRYQRNDRKAAIRGSYIRTIPGLQGPEWEYMYHSGYVSQDESDGENGMVTKRPESRAQWENNLYDAIHSAECEKANAKIGAYSHTPARCVELVKRPFPQLERGSGSGKVIVRIAFCGLSKHWRQTNTDDVNKHIHVLNMKVINKPDISGFLNKYPLLEQGLEYEIKEGLNDESLTGLAGHWDLKNEQGGGVLDIMERNGTLEGSVVSGLVNTYGSAEQVSGSELKPLGNKLIDPELLKPGLDTLCQPDRLHSQEKQGVCNESFGQETVPKPVTNVDAPPACYPEMPPPPPLADTSVAPFTADSSIDVILSGPSAKKGTEGEEKDTASLPKRRGRPPGSKNKKTKSNDKGKGKERDNEYDE